MSKVLFLDVDGVISLMPGVSEFNVLCLNQLKRIVDITNAYIVITSDWRKHDSLYEYLCRELKSRCIEKVVGKTPVVKPAELDRCKCETRFGVDMELRGVIRTLEIEQWLISAPGVTKYAIVDDDKLYFDERYFQVCAEHGLDKSAADKVISYLNGSDTTS